MNTVLLKGRLDRWKSSRNLNILFSATKTELCFEEFDDHKKNRVVWPSEDIIVSEVNNEEFIWIANEETKYLIKQKYLSTDGKSWIAMLRSQNLNRKTPTVANMIECCGEIVPYVEGYLQKWAAVKYNTRWFVISDDTLIYYSDYEQRKTKGSMLIRHINIVDNPENDYKSSFVLHDGVNKYHLTAKDDREKKEWIENLLKRGSKLTSKICCGELVLHFAGYLQKLAAVKYNKRWFVISDDTLNYYSDYEQRKTKGSMLIKDIHIFDNPDNDSKSSFILRDGINKYHLRANDDSEKKEWIENLTKRGSKLINKEQLRTLECWSSELVPYLDLPDVINKDEYASKGRSEVMKMNMVLLKGRLDKWKSNRTLKISFSATKEELRFEEFENHKKNLVVWLTENIIISDANNEEFLWIANKEAKYLIKEKLLTTDGKSWICMLRSRNLKCETATVDIIIECCGELVPYFEGYLQKWAAMKYNKRWFVLSDDTLNYYSDYEQKKIKGSMLIRHINIVDDIENKFKSSFILHDGINKYYLTAKDDSEKDAWIENLIKRGSKLINKVQLHSLEYLGKLIPALTFPMMSNKEEIFCEGENEDMTFLKHTKIVVKTIVENGVDATLKILVPAGGLIFMAVKGAVSGSIKIVDFFTQPDLADLEKKMDAKMDVKLFHSKLCSLEAEMFATHQRYCNILNQTFTLDQRVGEIPTAMQSFEKAIYLFTKDPLFLNNFFQMAHQLRKFSFFYLAFAEVAVVIHPNYKNEFKGQMRQLVECLETYKEKTLKIRLAAIQRHDTVGNKLILPAHIAPIIGSLVVQAVQGHEDPHYSTDAFKLTDHLYYANAKQNPKVAYMDVTSEREDEDEYEEFYNSYRDKIEDIYTWFFDEILLELKGSVVMN